MDKRIFLFLILGMFLISCVSALEFDNVKDYDSVEKIITITNAFGLGDKLAEYKLISNTEYCLYNCEATGEATLYFDDNLFSDIRFEDENGKEKLLNYDIYYKIKVDEKDLELIKDVETKEEWIKYNFESVEAGTYEWKIKGRNDIGSKVDWITSAIGEDFKEWAWWNSEWSNCKNIYINSSLTLNNAIIEKNITGLTFSNETEIRVVNQPCAISGDEVRSSVIQNGSNWALVNWLANLTNNNLTYSVYYNNPSNPSKTTELLKDHCEFNGNLCSFINGTPSNSQSYQVMDYYLNFTQGTIYSNYTTFNLTNYLVRLKPLTYVSTDSYSYLGISDSNEYVVSPPDRTSVAYIDNRGTFDTYISSGGGGEDPNVASGLDTNWTTYFVKLNESGISEFKVYKLNNSVGTVNSTLSISGNSNKKLFITNVLLNKYAYIHVDFIRAYETGTNYLIESSMPIITLGSEIEYSLTVNLTTPTNNYNTTNPNIFFNCSANDTTNIQNISLYINGIKNYTLTSGSVTYLELTKNYTLLDGSYNWSCLADNGISPISSDTRYFYIDSTTPSLTITSPNLINSYGYNGLNVSLNYSVSDINLGSCWYNYNGTNISLTSCSNSSFIISNEDTNLYLYANDTFGNLNTTYWNWSYKVFQNSIEFNNITRAGSQEDFILNITLGNGYDISLANLIYDTYNQTSTIFSNGQERLIKVLDYSVPFYEVTTNASFYFNLILNDLTEVNTTNNTQLVNTVFLDNCSAYTYELYNISLFDEKEKTPLLGNIELNYQLLSKPSYEQIQNINFSIENITSTKICSDINLTDGNFAESMEIKYYSNNYVSELYNIQRSDVIGTTKKLNLFDLESNQSTKFKITYQDDNFNFVSGAIIQLQRKYIAENLYETVEAPITSNEGFAIVHIDLDSNKYKAIVVKNGVVLNTFDNLVFDCQSELTGECEQKLLGEINPQNDISLNILKDFVYTISESNDTVTITFSIPSGTPNNINIQLTQKDQFGNTTLCNKTILSSAGSIYCDFDDSIFESYLEMKIYKNSVPVAIKTFIIQKSGEYDFLGNNFFIVFIILLSLVGMAISSPEWIIINGIMTMVVGGALYLLNGLDFVTGLGGLMWLVIAAGILIFKLAKQEDR